ncbi:MAG: HupE/UreJ family protein [Candidatus Eisenbacteria bacterium]
MMNLRGCFFRVAIAAVLLALVFAAWTASPAAAHGVGMSQLHVVVDGVRLEGDWTLHLRDARLALGLDTELAGDAGWQDLRPHEAELRALLLRSFAIRADGKPCTLAFTSAPLEWNAEASTVLLHFAGSAPVAAARLGMDCNLLFDRDPTHRAYFSVEDSRSTNVGAFRANLRSIEFPVRQFRPLEVVAEFIADGAQHIWSGFDHMLFLIALILPATLVRSGRTWTRREGLWPATREVLKVVTAFTATHMLTLCLAFFGVLRLRAQWVEVAIAVSVFAAAWNNLKPFLPGRAWVVALVFGLVHGLGFAGALGNLSLPRNAHVLALAAFNGGVELGQLVVVGASLPLLYVASRRSWYPRLVMGLGSLLIAWMAVLWALERAFNLTFFTRG